MLYTCAKQRQKTEARALHVVVASFLGTAKIKRTDERAKRLQTRAKVLARPTPRGRRAKESRRSDGCGA